MKLTLYIYRKHSQSNRTTTSANNTFDDIVVIWLAAAETTKKVHCTITAFNLSCSRSVIIEVCVLITSKTLPLVSLYNEDASIENREIIFINSNI